MVRRWHMGRNSSTNISSNIIAFIKHEEHVANFHKNICCNMQSHYFTLRREYYPLQLHRSRCTNIKRAHLTKILQCTFLNSLLSQHGLLILRLPSLTMCIPQIQEK